MESRHVHVSDLEIIDPGGDSVYIGGSIGGGPATDVELLRVTSRNAYRNGVTSQGCLPRCASDLRLCAERLLVVAAVDHWRPRRDRPVVLVPQHLRYLLRGTLVYTISPILHAIMGLNCVLSFP